MKNLLIALALVASATAPSLATVYPAGTSAHAIAVDQMVKHEIAGKAGPDHCLFINTATGECRQQANMNAGGGTSDGGISGGIGSAGSAGSAGSGH